MNANNISNDGILSELFFLIGHFLNNSSFKDSAQVLPKRIDWTGQEHSRTFQELSNIYQHIHPNFLLYLCNQTLNLLEDKLKFNISNTQTLLGSGQYSVLQSILDRKQIDKFFYATCKSNSSNYDALPKDFFVKNIFSNKSYFNFDKRSYCGGSNLILNLNKNQINGKLETNSIIQPEIFRSINLHKRSLVHLSQVYCVCFDRTGRFVLTGADDKLIKAFSTQDGRLLATFRGHEKEISDIEINFENTLLASGSCDKSIRVWNLQSTENIEILQGHNSMVTSIEFSPYCRGDTRWLASSGNDGVICFWQWNSKNLMFNPKPRKFVEKSRPGAQITCVSFSSGGSYLAAGSNDHATRVFYFDGYAWEKIGELESHSNIVDSIQYANNSAKFLSGSVDGTARIWQYNNLEWNGLVIDGSKTLQNKDEEDYSCIEKKYPVTMVTWNCDDTLVVTSLKNFIIKVWNSNDAQLIHELKGHSDEIFVLEAHPKDPRLLLSSGHDGNVILWNLLTGKIIKKFYNRIENQGHGCVFDTKWSPSMDMFAATDSHGFLSIFGFGKNDNFKQIPEQIFFHTDYRPLMHDSNGFAIDEQTQRPPHLMQPPFLVDADGNPYSTEYQRLVPGRENLTEAQLEPNIITNENGIAEIIGERELDNQEEMNVIQNDDGLNGNENFTRTRRRIQFEKNLIRPLDSVVLKTNESIRLSKLEIEETCFLREKENEQKRRIELKEKELHKSNSFFSGYENNNSNMNKKRRGRQITVRSNSGSKVRNRLTERSAFNTDNEDERLNEIRINNIEYDEETLDIEGNYIDVDDDSNTQYSIGGGGGVFSRTAIGNNNRPQTSTSALTNTNFYIDPIDLESESASSEYSDWAEEDGRQTLKPPPRRVNNSRPKRGKRKKRILKVEDDEENNNIEGENDEDSFIKVSKKRTSRRLKRIISDDDEEEEKEILPKKKNFKDELKTDSENDDGDEESSLNEDFSDENYDSIDSNKPCTSNTANSRNSKSTKKKSRKSLLKANKLKHTNSKTSSYTNGKKELARVRSSTINNKNQLNKAFRELPIEYRPPEWLTGTKPKKSPYVPQIGDEVVYFRQGHQLYFEAVRRNNAYEIDEKSLPWNSFKQRQIDVQEICKVVGLKVEIKPPRLVCLKLCVIDKTTNKMTNSKFSIKYHDMDNVADFVILRQFYERGIEKDWRAKDRFKCIIDDVWWIGVIDCRKPFEEKNPNSEFQCLQITWDSGESEALSPWDLEPLSGVNSRKTKNVSSANLPANGESMIVTQEEMQHLLYVPNSDEWPDEGRDVECQRILNGLETIMQLSLAEHFSSPVDLDAFPCYGMVIQYPVDLNTIKERLENRYYRRINSIIWDIRKIEQNAITFNDPKSSIVSKAIFLTELLNEFVNDHHCTNPMPIYKRMCKDKKLPQDTDEIDSTENSVLMNKSIYDNEYEDEELFEIMNQARSTRTRKTSQLQASSSNNNNNGTTLKIDKKNKSSVNDWKSNCKKLVNDLIEHPDSEPFRDAVDLIEYPDYLMTIDGSPMDLGTIKKNLEQNVYTNLQEFDLNCKQIFKNSKSYNTIKRSKIYGMTLRLSAFYEERIKNIFEKFRNDDISKYGRTRKTRINDNDYIYENKQEIKLNSNSKNTKQNFQNSHNKIDFRNNHNNNKAISNSVSFSTSNSSGFNFVTNVYSTRSSSTKKTIKNENQSESLPLKFLLNKSLVEDQSLIQDDVVYDINDSNNQLQHNSTNRVLNQTNSSNEDFKGLCEIANKSQIDNDYQEDNKFHFKNETYQNQVNFNAHSNENSQNFSQQIKTENRNDSETALSYNDAIENEAHSNILRSEKLNSQQFSDDENTCHPKLKTSRKDSKKTKKRGKSSKKKNMRQSDEDENSEENTDEYDLFDKEDSELKEEEIKRDKKSRKKNLIKEEDENEDKIDYEQEGITNERHKRYAEIPYVEDETDLSDEEDYCTSDDDNDDDYNDGSYKKSSRKKTTRLSSSNNHRSLNNNKKPTNKSAKTVSSKTSSLSITNRSSRLNNLRSNKSLDDKENDDDFESKNLNNTINTSHTSNNNTTTTSDQEYQTNTRQKIGANNASLSSNLKFSNVNKKLYKESNSVSAISKKSRTRLSKRVRTKKLTSYREESSSSNLTEPDDEEKDYDQRNTNKNQKINGNHSRKKRRYS